LSQSWTNRKESGGPGEPSRDRRAFEPRRPAQRERGEEGRFRYANLGVRFEHPAFRRGDIRSFLCLLGL
jgi:hypothetical protein